MPIWPFTSKKGQAPAPPETAPTGAAGGERYQSAVLTCSLGTIVEVWRTGIIIRANRPIVPTDPAAPIDLDLCGPVDEVSLKARVVRIKPGSRGVEIELAFVDPSSDTQDAVENLARFGRTRARAPGETDARVRDQIVQAAKLPDYYAVLGLRVTATDAEIQAAFRLLARRYHPDVCKEPDAQQRFCAISEAHEVLGDPERRAEYDRLSLLRNVA
ncbi:MAG: DnaJ domain-containing protein [Phycisphaerales bacterium]|nr:DnaJ domain-containing protein [Phycisphaerales bacterium]